MLLKLLAMKFCLVREEVTGIELLREQPAGSRVRPASPSAAAAARGAHAASHSLLQPERSWRKRRELISNGFFFQRGMNSKVGRACRKLH